MTRSPDVPSTITLHLLGRTVTLDPLHLAGLQVMVALVCALLVASGGAI